MNERLYQLRKETGLSRAAFGAKIGVSGDVINNLERGRVDIKDSTIKLICAVFSVDETWFRTGKGEMLIGTSDALLDQLSREYNLDEYCQRLLFSFLNLSPEKRKIVLDYVKQTIAVFNSGIFSDIQVESNQQEM